MVDAATLLKAQEYNRLGIIPGPKESAEDFFRRAEHCLRLKELLAKDSALPFANPASTRGVRIQEIYDIDPVWVPLFYSNHGLRFWQGGCAWIFQLEEHSPTGAFIQLRKEFAEKKCYLGLYQREELLDHELAHIGRMSFEEPQFEEFFAYYTSPFRLRRFFGPVFQSSRETTMFFILLLIVFFADLSVVSLGRLSFYPLLLWTKALPMFFLFAAFARLCWRWRQFYRCLEKLGRLADGDERKAQALLYRLTDREIIDFAGMEQGDIEAYVERQDSLRWKVWKRENMV